MKRNFVFGLAAVLALGACDEDGTGVEGDAMTEAEATAVASIVANTSGDATSEGLTEVTQSGGDGAGTITLNQTTTHPCPEGGAVEAVMALTLDYDNDAGSFELDADGTLTHDGCAFNRNGVTFTVDGDPSLSLAAFAAAEAGEPSGDWTSSADGAFLWSASDGREGRCVIDVTTVTDFVAQERTVSGEVCGHTIEQTLTWES
jgi:hypothetical protein